MTPGDWTLLGSWQELLDRLGWDASSWGSRLALAALVLLVAFVANWVAKRIIVRGLRALAKRTTSDWDDALVRHRVFTRLSQLAPALVLFAAAPVLFPGESEQLFATALSRLANLWMVLAGAVAVSSFFDAVALILSEQPATRDKPIRSYVQVAKIVLWLAVAILAVATLMNKNPWTLLGGLGAMTAVLLLVFKDSILGFVASVRIAANDMLRIGDWVEMPKYGADGDVVDIGLHTVKIQNWDKTISMVPTHTFMTDTFKNWRGMTESGGRRIKRSLLIDMTSVRFLEEDDVERLKKISAIAPYLEQRANEVKLFNEAMEVDPSSVANGRRLTNLGTFRAYIEAYLNQLEPIRKDMTFLVRQLAPTTQGVPMEIYCFSGEQRWTFYEGILGDIFDHLLAVVSEFELRVYQQPSSEDMRAFAQAGG